jgi:hypothetical protein
MDEKNLNQLDPESFNNEKRKRLGEAVHHSFLHPKPFKVGKLSLPKIDLPIKQEKKTNNDKLVKNSKHKFKII